MDGVSPTGGEITPPIDISFEEKGPLFRILHFKTRIGNFFHFPV